MTSPNLSSVEILGTGSYLPERLVTNAEVAQQMDSTEEWIFSHTGIRARHVAAPDESAASLGTKAAQRALEAAHVTPEEIGLIVCATTSPDYGTFPATGCLIQHALGCTHAGAFDLSCACSGFVYALEMARAYVMMHPTQKVLVIGTDVLTRTVDWYERTVSILFGDGAGAVVLGRTRARVKSPVYSLLGSDGSGAQAVYREGGSRLDPSRLPPMEGPTHYMKMQGRVVFSFAVRKLAEIITSLCNEAQMKPSELNQIISHQANGRIIEAVAKRLELPLDLFFMNIETVGNTSAASIPICLDEAVRKESLKKGDRFVLAGFGSGLSWAGLLATWPYV